VTRTALVIEIEEVLFATHALRVTSFRQALGEDGIIAAPEDLDAALAGATLAMAAANLPACRTLDVVGRELLVRRADDAFRAAIGGHPPGFDTLACDALRALAIDYPIAVVTRASQADSRLMLEMAGLDESVNVIRSLAVYDIDQYPDAWQDAVRRVHAERGIAIAPAPLLAAAQAAGLRTLTVDTTMTGGGGALVSLSSLGTSYIDSLF
jgi:hypothetical protein